MIVHEMFLKTPPAGQPRPRFRVQSGHACAYPSPKQQKLEKAILEQLMDQMPAQQIDGCIKVDLTALFPIPKAVAKKDRPLLDGKLKVTKPDIDNVAKLILDVFTKAGLWKDDNRVAVLNVQKRWIDDPVGGWSVRIESTPLASVRA